MVFGDSAFALSRHVQRMLRGMARRTARGKKYNRTMGRVRVTIENAFAGVLNSWGMVGHKRINRLGSMPLAKHMSVAILLYNLQGIWYGNQMVVSMGAMGESLRERLSVRQFLAMAL